MKNNVQGHIHRIDSLISDIQIESKNAVEALELLARELNYIADEQKKLRLAIESSSEEDNSAVDKVMESMDGIADDLPGLMEKCELEVEELIKLVTTDMQQAFEEIARTEI
jgi:hypothetical protein